MNIEFEIGTSKIRFTDVTNLKVDPGSENDSLFVDRSGKIFRKTGERRRVKIGEWYISENLPGCALQATHNWERSRIQRAILVPV